MRNALQIVGVLALVALGVLVVLETQSVLGGGPPRGFDRIFLHDREAVRKDLPLHDDAWARVHSCSPWRFMIDEPFDVESPLVLWCVDDDGRIVPLVPELVRRGRVERRPFGWVPR